MAQILTNSPTGSKQKLKNHMVNVDFLFGNLAIPGHTVKTKMLFGSIHYEVYFCNIILETNDLNFALCSKISICHRHPL